MLVIAMEDPEVLSFSREDPLAKLRNRLQRLYRHAGEPSTREVSRRTSKAISHTTVHGVLRCAKIPRWGQLELIVEALHGDIDEFRALWIMVRDAADGLEAAMPEPTPSQDQAAKFPRLRAEDSDLHRQRADPPVRQVEATQSYAQAAASRQPETRFASPESYSIRTVVAIEITDLAAIKQLFPQTVWLPILHQLYGTVRAIATEADPNVVVDYFDKMIMLVFDADRASDALNAVIEIQEAVTSMEFGQVRDLNCSIGISSGEVVEFADYNTKLHYLGTVVDQTLGLCSAANSRAIFIDRATAAAVNMARVRSRVGQALGHSPHQYQGDSQRVALKGVSQPVEYYEIRWDKQIYGVKSSAVTEIRRGSEVPVTRDPSAPLRRPVS